MALAALIAAYHESGEAGALRAVLPLAGRTLVERQARLAARAGATRIVVLVERLPAELGAALERLRRDRLPIHVARDVEEAAEAIEPADRLLLIGDGAIIDEDQLARLAEGEDHAVLTVPDSVHGELYERIDGQSRWGGAAAIDGADAARDRRDAARLGSAIDAAAPHAAGRRAACRGGPAAGDHRSRSRRRRAGGRASSPMRWRRAASWIDRLLAPIERLLASALLGGSVGPGLIGGVAARPHRRSARRVSHGAGTGPASR